MRGGRQTPPAPVLWSRGSDLIACLLLTAASPFFHGYSFGLQNQHIQVPHLFALQDTSLYPADALIVAMRSYFSYFWPAIAWLTERTPIEATFLVLHLTIVFLRFLGLTALARGLWPTTPWAPFAALWLAFFGHSGIGYESLNWTYLTHTTLATAMGLWALAAAVRGRVLTTALIAGLLFDLHAMQSAYVVLMAGTAFLAVRDVRRREVLVGLGIYLLAAAPGLAWLLRSGGLRAPDGFADLVRTFFPYHFFPSSFSFVQWLAFGAYASALGLAAHAIERTIPVRRALAMAAAIMALWIVGGVWIEVWPLAVLIKLHVFRSSTYLFLVLAALLSGVLVKVCRALDERAGTRVAGVVLALLVAVPASIHLIGYPVRVAMGLCVAGAMLLLGVLLPVARARRGAAQIGLLTALVVFGWLILERGRAAAALPRSQEPWHEVQLWARANTPVDAVFLTPPYISGFRVYSRRSVVGEVQDGSGMLWSSTYADYWRTWFERLTGPLDGEDVTSWDRLAREWFAKEQAEIEAIGREYGADFIVIRQPRSREADRGWRLDWSGTPLFDNGVFAAYALTE